MRSRPTASGRPTTVRKHGAGASGVASPTARRRASPRRVGGDRVARRASRKWGGRFIAVLALALAGGAIWFLVELFQPFHGSPHGSVTVTIPPHSSSRPIGDQLARDGVVSSGFFFELRATLAGERGDLRAGTYHLQQGMTYGKVLKVLTTRAAGAADDQHHDHRGHDSSPDRRAAEPQGVKGSYFAATRHSPLLNPAAYGAPRHTPDLEGFLFPDTYQLVEPISIPSSSPTSCRRSSRSSPRSTSATRAAST